MRIRFNDEAKLLLNIIFNLTQYPSRKQKSNLSIILGKNVRSINIWFQNARINFRKTHKFKSKSENSFNISKLDFLALICEILKNKCD
ncbi:Homeobox protein HD-11 [Pseudoloma neurophilia]|uniref:Homeobox protein HD-11 n=1 Tax=Pseudoloma neurophilia TaxID=146866 RepID=A0A0R0LZT7_9MICR|nr:Homeobox protein HD-11 [Pseudoloma neurophilia]